MAFSMAAANLSNQTGPAVPKGRTGGRPSSSQAPLSVANALLNEERLRRRVRVGDAAAAPQPPPTKTVYHAGLGQYQPASMYRNSGRPRRCRSGSGAPSYSTRKPAEVLASAVPAPIAGAFAPQPAEPATAFCAARAEGSLPVRIRNNTQGGALRVEWTTPVDEVDVRAVLPLLLEGVRDTGEDGRFLATQGAAELIAAAGPKGTALRVVALVVPPLRAALETFDPPVVCAAMHLLRQLLTSHRLAGAALRPHYRQLLPKIAPLVLRGQERQLKCGEYDRSGDREMNPSDLAGSLLHEMELRGGSGAGAEIKGSVPSWRPAEEELHRGFVAPLFRNGDRVHLAQGTVAHTSGGTAPAKGTGSGATTLHGLKGHVGERVDLAVHGRPRLAASFVNPPRPPGGRQLG